MMKCENTLKNHSIGRCKIVNDIHTTCDEMRTQLIESALYSILGRSPRSSDSKDIGFTNYPNSITDEFKIYYKTEHCATVLTTYGNPVKIELIKIKTIL